MRSLFLHLITCCCFLVSGALFAQDSGAPLKGADNARKPLNRCAYLGQWGSFHLTGDKGTAAYSLGDKKYIADLMYSGQDAYFWYFTPTNGDPSTTTWAFARKKDCGKYWVWRRKNRDWRQYELAKGWGQGLDEPLRSVKATATDALIQNLREAVNEHETRIKALEIQSKALDGSQ